MTSAQHVNLIGQPVRSLQTMLRELSYRYPFLPRLTPDGVFGERTLEAVMLFQRELFPPVTGRVDQGVWDAIAGQYLDALSHTAPPLPLRGFPAGGRYEKPTPLFYENMKDKLKFVIYKNHQETKEELHNVLKELKASK